MNDGFDGSGLPGRVLTGDDVHRLLIQDLTFRDSSAPAGNGGAISITGESSVQIFTSEFYANTADGQGGAVSVASQLRRGRRDEWRLAAREHVRLADHSVGGQLRATRAARWPFRARGRWDQVA